MEDIIEWMGDFITGLLTEDRRVLLFVFGLVFFALGITGVFCEDGCRYLMIFFFPAAPVFLYYCYGDGNNGIKKSRPIGRDLFLKSQDFIV
jgi:hypothetical protein